MSLGQIGFRIVCSGFHFGACYSDVADGGAENFIEEERKMTSDMLRHTVLETGS